MSVGCPAATPVPLWSCHCGKTVRRAAEPKLCEDLTIAATTFVLVFEVGDYLVEILEGEGFEDLSLAQGVARNVAQLGRQVRGQLLHGFDKHFFLLILLRYHSSEYYSYKRY